MNFALYFVVEKTIEYIFKQLETKNNNIITSSKSTSIYYQSVP
jgi:hypothetical protein